MTVDGENSIGYQTELAYMGRLLLAGEMAAELAHELSQPLAVIISLTDTCLSLVQEKRIDSEGLLRALEMIANQSRRADEIIRHLKHFTRKTPLQRKPVNLNEITREVIHFLDNELERYVVKMNIESGNPIPLVLADPVQIQQVILNLIKNAIEAMAEIEVSKRELNVKILPIENNTIKVTISDTGTGIPADSLKQLFYPFFTTKIDGMGLGLSISKSIIESHEGKLWITSNKDPGSTFHFTLPIHTEI